MTSRAVDLKIGKNQVTVPLEPKLSWENLRPGPLAPHTGLTEACALTQIDDTLESLIGGAESPARYEVVVVLPDETRPAPSARLVNGVLERLAKRGIQQENIHILIASGTHRASDIQYLRSLWELPASVRVGGHDCMEAGDILGETTRGTVIELNPLYLGADARITMSAVSLHYFAGFGGGPKMVFPGLATRSGVIQNHRLALASLPPGGLHPDCAPGRVEGNPVAEDLREAAALALPEISIHWIRGQEGDRYFLGEEGLIRSQRSLRGTSATGQAHGYDFVIASAGGHPFDIDLVQSHKSLRHAGLFTRPGGVVLLLAEGSKGAGSGSLETWLGLPDGPILESRARSDYDLNAQTAISLRELAREYHVVWLTGHLQSLLEPCGVNAVSTIERALEICRASLPVSGGALRGGILPMASSVIPNEV